MNSVEILHAVRSAITATAELLVHVLDKDIGSLPPVVCLSAVRLSAVGQGDFPVARTCIWNDLPSDDTSSPSLLAFKQRLKMHSVDSTPGLPFNCSSPLWFLK